MPWAFPEGLLALLFRPCPDAQPPRGLAPRWMDSAWALRTLRVGAPQVQGGAGPLSDVRPCHGELGVPPAWGWAGGTQPGAHSPLPRQTWPRESLAGGLGGSQGLGARTLCSERGGEGNRSPGPVGGGAGAWILGFLVPRPQASFTRGACARQALERERPICLLAPPPPSPGQPGGNKRSPEFIPFPGHVRPPSHGLSFHDFMLLALPLPPRSPDGSLGEVRGLGA